MVFIFTLTAQNTKESGEMISNTDTVLNSGSMEVNTKDSISTLRNMVSDNTYGLMVTNILVNGLIMPSMELVCISGQTEESTTEVGKTT